MIFQQFSVDRCSQKTWSSTRVGKWKEVGRPPGKVNREGPGTPILTGTSPACVLGLCLECHQHPHFNQHLPGLCPRTLHGTSRDWEKKGSRAECTFTPPVEVLALRSDPTAERSQPQERNKNLRDCFLSAPAQCESQERRALFRARPSCCAVTNKTPAWLVAVAPLWFPTSVRTWVPHDSHFLISPCSLPSFWSRSF